MSIPNNHKPRESVSLYNRAIDLELSEPQERRTVVAMYRKASRLGCRDATWHLRMIRELEKILA